VGLLVIGIDSGADLTGSGNRTFAKRGSCASFFTHISVEEYLNKSGL